MGPTLGQLFRFKNRSNSCFEVFVGLPTFLFFLFFLFWYFVTYYFSMSLSFCNYLEKRKKKRKKKKRSVNTYSPGCIRVFMPMKTIHIKQIY
jgi:hypothetical protein